MEENKNRKARKGVGRKSKSDPAVYRYGIKFNSRENAQFELSFQKSGMAYRARFIKSVLLNKGNQGGPESTRQQWTTTSVLPISTISSRP